MVYRSDRGNHAITAALVAVSERWTLLIVLELMAGPHRFTDLADELPGISTNLLARRLKSLEQSGMIRRRVLSPHTKVMVYELTAKGQALKPTLAELGKWGNEFMMPSVRGAGEGSG